MFGLIGALMPLRPLLFTNRSEPVAERVDWILTPLYAVGPLLPPMGDIGELTFLLLAAILNATLYSLAARYVLDKFSK